MSVKAVCVLGQSSDVSGVINFEQKDKVLTVSGTIKGLTMGLHGFHIHQFGDNTNGCTSAGAHFNPHGKNHGAREDEERHVGDFGNIKANDEGIATFSFQDTVASLTGVHSIVGRSIVVHADPDDKGLGGHSDSLTTGHAGARVACGVIGICKD